MPAFHIHIQGQVQGVGFRPFVYKKACAKKLKGWVNNTNTGVHIEIEGTEQTVSTFYKEIIENAPELSIITSSSIKQTDTRNFKCFDIIHSQNSEQPNLLLTSDYSICKDCLDELFDKNNRRYLYPFITCTNCGPRYSIIKKLPYDRENTTMENFQMCEKCQTEYENPLERRYYSQTNSCSVCAVKFSIFRPTQHVNQQDVISLVQISLREGKIIAIKGIGGYLLLADATNANTINTLRKRKRRPFKPFALMYPSDKSLLLDVSVSKPEWESYESIQAPIVLFKLKQYIGSNLKKDLIAPKLDQIGVMKPYTPLYALIVSALDFPIIATSANISDSPIIYEDFKANQELSAIADLIIGNNREIVVPQDDSVMKFSQEFDQKIIIRRSRGFAPTFIDRYNNLNSNKCLLGMGAGLKASFSLYHQSNTYVSQYLGNLNSFESQQSFEKVLNYYFNLFQAKPDIIVTDKHQQYFSTQFGLELRKKDNAQIYEVQHHKAHFAAVLAENNLINTANNVLGVIWDGLGLGDDKNIWGGEFFTYRGKQMLRRAHFEYFPHLALDKFAMEPRLPAFTISNGLNYSDELLIRKFTPIEWLNYQKLYRKDDNLKTSSVGRLFDAVACLLGLKDINSFEGEAAMILENKASHFYRKNTMFKEAYIPEFETNTISIANLANQILDDIKSKKDKGEIAFKFHLTLVQIIKIIADNYLCKHLAFSGGVFQNSLLIDLINKYLSKEYHLYFHQQLSANDENISYGQLTYINNKIK